MGHPLLPPARLAVLDLAGTTVSDDGTVEAAFLDAFADLAVPVDAEMKRFVTDTMGQAKITVFRALLQDETAAQRANKAFEAAFARRVAAGEVQPIAGARAVIDQLHDAGIAVCLTTGFSAETRTTLLEHLGWTDVELVLSPDATLRGRPYPDLVLAAVLRLAVDDVRSVVVAGDTANDLLSGWRAGAGVVAGVLTGAHDRATLGAAPHTHIIDSIAELPAIVLGP